MGTSEARIRFNDGTIYYGGYQNTTDVITGDLFCKTSEEFWDAHDNNHHSSDSVCKCEIEPVVIADNYGGGKYWNGKACKLCGALYEGFDPYPDSNISEHGDYRKQVKEAEELIKNQALQDGCPDWWSGCSHD